MSDDDLAQRVMQHFGDAWEAVMGRESTGVMASGATHTRRAAPMAAAERPASESDSSTAASSEPALALRMPGMMRSATKLMARQLGLKMPPDLRKTQH